MRVVDAIEILNEAEGEKLNRITTKPIDNSLNNSDSRILPEG
jgi:hypothetical protein